LRGNAQHLNNGLPPNPLFGSFSVFVEQGREMGPDPMRPQRFKMPETHRLQAAPRKMGGLSYGIAPDTGSVFYGVTQYRLSQYLRQFLRLIALGII
jgi:hypothetical protein